MTLTVARERRSRSDLRTILETFIVGALVFLVFNTFVAQSYQVQGSSMEPTFFGPHQVPRCLNCSRPLHLQSDALSAPAARVACPFCQTTASRLDLDVESTNLARDQLFVHKSAFELRTPGRWEPIVFRHPEGDRLLIVKRIVGLPGETIQLEGGDVLINGQRVAKSLGELLQLAHAIIDLNHAEVARRAKAPMETIRLISLPQGEGRDGAAVLDFDADRPPRELVITWPARTGQRFVLSYESRTGHYRVSQKSSDTKVLAEGIASVRELRARQLSFGVWDGKVVFVVGDKKIVDLVVSYRPDEHQHRPDDVDEHRLSVDVASPAELVQRLRILEDVDYRETPFSETFMHGTINPVTLASDEYFVLGDNPCQSIDSRFWATPGVKHSLVLGRPIAISWPTVTWRMHFLGKDWNGRRPDFSRMKILTWPTGP